MHSKCDLPNFDEHDFKQFDFTRWHLDGLTLDAASAAFAGLAERLTNSPEWQQHVQASLPQLHTHVLASYQERSRELQEQQAITAKEFDHRIDAAEERAKAFRKSTEAAAAPPSVEQSPDAYHLAVKVNTRDRLGLPGLIVQMMDPKEEKNVLAQAVTDPNGNAVLTLPADAVKEFDKQDTSFEILTPDGKVLQKEDGAVCVRIGQTETKVATIDDSAAIADHKAIGLRVQSEQEFEIRKLGVRIETLKSEREKRLRDFDQKLHCNQEIIDEIERAKPKPPPKPPADDTDPDDDESSGPGMFKRKIRSPCWQGRKK